MKTLTNKKRKGFTLVELIVVVIIIGILAAVGITRFQGASRNAQVSAFRANHQIMISAINMFAAAHNGELPADGEKFNEFITVTQDGGSGGATGIDSLQNRPIAGTTYEWTGGTLTSKLPAANGGAEVVLTFTP